MSELRTYICPNCGASTTNSRSCEYCGSILVRFVEKGIDLSHTIYTDNTEVFPGLIPELERNLKLQKLNPNQSVTTDLLMDDGDLNTISIMSHFCWHDRSAPSSFDFGRIGLRIVYSFAKYSNEGTKEVLNSKTDDQLERFRQLTSFPLFSSHFCSYTDTSGYARIAYQYAIDCGQDVETTGRLVSEILLKVKGWLLTDSFDIMTNVGNNVKIAREAWLKAHGYEDDSSAKDDESPIEEEESNDYQWFWIGIAILSIICSLLGVIS